MTDPDRLKGFYWDDWLPAVKNLIQLGVVDSHFRLYEQLGADHVSDITFDKEKYGPIVRALKGPYAKAILKAYRIKEGLE